MDLKSGEDSRHRRKTRSDENEKWECSVCTYINPSESYKCEICFMRKGTSTRKPRLNPQVLEQQQLIAQAILKEKDEEHRKKKSDRTTEKPVSRESNVKLKNFDRSSPLLFEIFANGYSVVITEFPPKSKGKSTHFPDSPAASNCSSLLGFSGATSAVPDQLSPTDSNSNSDAVGRAFPFADPDYGEPVETKAKIGSNHLSRHLYPTRSANTATCGERSTSAVHTGSLVSSFVEVTHSNQPGSPLPSSSVSCPPVSTQKHEFTPELRCVAALTKSDTKSDHSCFSGSMVSRKSSRSDYGRGVAKSNSRSVKYSSSSNEIRSSSVLSSRRKRLPADDIRLRSSAVNPRKRRKLVLTRSRLVTPKPTHKRTRLSKSRRSSASTGRRVTHQLQSVSSDSVDSPVPVKENVTPLDVKKIQSGKRFSSTPLGLKCKIRVIPSTDSISKSSYRAVESQSKSMELPNAGLDAELSRNGGDDDSSGRSTSESGEAKPSRLSTESKNTSAMTDSGGATALEMSG